MYLKPPSAFDGSLVNLFYMHMTAVTSSKNFNNDDDEEEEDDDDNIWILKTKSFGRRSFDKDGNAKYNHFATKLQEITQVHIITR